MAKRRRLTPFDPGAIPPLAMLSARASGPIADVAGDASTHAALDALADEMSAARAQGRMIEAIPLVRIKPNHLIRDRIAVDGEEMEALVESLRARGQQAPAEVVALNSGRFGLISGWRRFRALERLHAETGEARFATIAAIIRTPQSAADAYLGMVEENEIRAGVSFYERARLAAEAARIGVHADVPAAIAALYARATASKRSKIGSFVTLHEELGAHLRYGSAISEKLGLALVQALKTDDGFGPRLRDALRQRKAGEAEADGGEVDGVEADGGETVDALATDVGAADVGSGGPKAERDILERALRKSPVSGSGSKVRRGMKGEEVSPGLFLDVSDGRAILSGPGLDVAALRHWIAGRG